MDRVYRVIELYTSEEARWQGRPLWEAVLGHVAEAPSAARCLVSKAVAGCYEGGEMAGSRLEVLSYNLPVKVEIVVPATEARGLLDDLQPMVGDGILAVRDVAVVVHSVRRRLVPPRLRVRDVMAAPVTAIGTETPAADVIRLLLAAAFNAVPVADDRSRPVGIITQGDLIERAHMPIRLGLLAQLDCPQLEEYLGGISDLTAEHVMTRPVVTVEQDERLDRVVQVMLRRGLKRLPVVDRQGKLVGMVARLDVFGAIVDGVATTQTLAAHHVRVCDAAVVGDIMARERDAVPARATGADILELLRRRAIQRVAVVDENGRLLGLVADIDVLSAVSGRRGGFWDYLSRRPDLARAAEEKTAAQVMKTDLVTVTEDTPIEEAVRLMAHHGLKRLPVVDHDGLYRGMIDRQAVLSAGAADESADAP